METTKKVKTASKTKRATKQKTNTAVETASKTKRTPRQKLNINEALENSTFLADMLAIVTEAGFIAEDKVKARTSEAYKTIHTQMMPSRKITLKGEKDFMEAAITRLVNDGKMKRTRTHGVVYCHVQPLP